jgi:RHS repeat-associated protein
VCPAASTTLSDAYRYDGFGQQIANAGTITNPWRYRGLLNLTQDFGSGALLAMAARDYAPQLGVFTQEDSVAGSAANPLTMNRFLYALANPATLVDPDGHMADACGGATCGGYVAPKPYIGALTGGDCSQSCIDYLNNTAGINTRGTSGTGTSTPFVPPGYAPPDPGFHWSSVPTLAGQYQLLYDGCSISDAGYYHGECVNEVQMKAIEDFGAGVLEGTAQAAALAFLCGATAGGCALIVGAAAIGTAHAVYEGGLEAVVPQDARGWGVLAGFGVFGGFGPAGRIAEGGSSVRGALSGAYGRMENYYSWRSVRSRMGPADNHPNPAFPRGIEYQEATHTFIPQRSWVPNFIKNRAWNIRLQWGSTHALNDPYRFNFMPKWWRDAMASQQKSGLLALLSRIFDN